MVDLIKVSKTFPPDIQALADVSLTVSRGEIVFLTGRSGAGKTTLLRLLCGMEFPDKGVVEVAGRDIGKLSRSDIQALRRRIGMAYQDFRLLPDRTVSQNIAISMEVAYRSNQFIRKQVRRLLAELRLTDKHGARAGTLSRGEQQRVAIARALANEPDLILADEPTGNLDAETTALVMNLFRRCNRAGATLIIATHDQTIYRQPGNRVAVLRFGRLRSGRLQVRRSAP